MVADEVRVRLQNAGQEHLLQFWNDLSDAEQSSLLSQIKEIDLEAINTYYKYVVLYVSNVDVVAWANM